MTERLDAKDRLEFEHYRQKSFKPFDRRKSKAKPRHKDYSPLRFAGLRGNSKAVLVDTESRGSADIRSEYGCPLCTSRAMEFYRGPEVRREVQLVDLIRPGGKKAKQAGALFPHIRHCDDSKLILGPDSFEVVRLNRHVIALDDEEDWEDDWGRVDSREAVSRPSYAAAASGKRRDRRGRGA